MNRSYYAEPGFHRATTAKRLITSLSVVRVTKILKWLFDLYIFGNIHIAFCALAFTLTTQMLLRLPLRGELLLFVFCGTFFGYNLQRLPCAFRGGKIDRIFKRHYWNTEHRRLLAGLSIQAALIFAWSFSRLYLRSQVVAMVPAALSFAYALPVIPTRRKWIELREISGLKIFIIAVTWACSCALLPVASVHQTGAAWFSPAAILWAVACVFLIFALTVPFDIRDLRFDAEKLKAMPALVGVKNSLRIAVASLVAADAVMWLAWWNVGVGTVPQIIAFSGWCALAAVFVYESSPDRNEYYFSFWIDGLLVVLWGMVWIAGLIGHR